MTTDYLHARAREAASSHLIGKADFLGDKFEAFVAGYLAHAAQQPSREDAWTEGYDRGFYDREALSPEIEGRDATEGRTRNPYEQNGAGS